MIARRAARVVAACALACVALARTASADWTLVEERHFAQSLAGKPCGRSSERIEADGELVRTRGTLELRFRRLGEETRVDLASTFVETRGGDPVSAEVVQSGGATVRFAFARSERGWRVAVDRGTGTAPETAELADDFLTPREVAAFVAARHEAGAAEIRYRALDVQSGLSVAEVAMTRGAGERFAFDGREIAATRYAVRNSLLPVAAHEVLDGAGRTLVSSVEFPGLGTLESRLATRAAADAAAARATFDLIAGTFVRTPAITRWSTRATLVLGLAVAEGELPELPSEGAQRFERIDARRAIVTVDIARGSAAAEGDADDPRWLRATELLDFASAPVVELLASAAARAPADATPFEIAERLRRLVGRHLVDKNLATAFGSASEAARMKGGDCTEHAVLLAALLRARGIPSRVASGLVFVPNLAGNGPGFGWHLWTQALVPPSGGGDARWFDLDATVGATGRGYHAAHLLVATSGLEGGATDPSFARAMALMGGLAIAPDVDAEAWRRDAAAASEVGAESPDGSGARR
ncbi:MAG: hypothetical protein RI967_994 [Planctomycetota bacterium]